MASVSTNQSSSRSSSVSSGSTTTGSSSSSVASVSSVVMPPVSIANYQQQQQIISQSTQSNSASLVLPPAQVSSGRSVEGSSGGLAEPILNSQPLHSYGWELKQEPAIVRILKDIGNALVSLLKLFTPKKGI